MDNLLHNELIMLKVLDLFSGIGGFSLGLESTGHFETVAFCEKDQFCQKVLKKHWSNIPIIDDVRRINGKEIKADVVTGGFPCQPFSVAGKRKGTDDDRYLWDETIRVVRECKPKYFIGENVEGLINIQQGMVLRQVQTDLEKEGFEVQCLIIPASGIGAWHQRKRIWIIGCDVSNSRSRNAQSRCVGQKLSSEEIEKGKTTRSTWSNSSSKNRTWWQTQSELCGVPNGVSYELDKDRANRVKALGNSIVPQIARELGKAIIEAENV